MQVPDYSAYFKPFSTTYIQNGLRFWGCNRWQYFLVENPVDGSLEVQINQYQNSLTTEEILVTYFLGNAHGIFGFEVMDRYFSEYPFSQPHIRKLYQDFVWSMLQPMRNIVVSFLPTNLDEFQHTSNARIQNEFFIYPNVKVLRYSVEFV